MQQMAQMQAAGVRPVGMADGGIVRRGFAYGGINNAARPAIDPPTPMFGEGRLRPSVQPIDSDEEKAALALMESGYTPEIAEELFTEQEKKYNAPTSEFTRFLRRILGNKPPNKSEMINVMEDVKDSTEDPYSFNQSKDLKISDAVKKARQDNPVPSFFSESTPKEVAQAEARQAAAMKEAGANLGGSVSNSPVYMGGPLAGADVNSGILKIPIANSAPKPVVEGKPIVETPKEDPAEDRKLTALEAIKAEREAQKNQNFNMALMQAGLAMMAGKSPNALQNIAEGGISGLAAYTGLEKSDRETALSERKLGAYEDSLRRNEDYNTARALALSDKAKKDMQAIAIRAEELAGKELADAVKNDTEGKLASQDQRENWYLARVRALKRNLGIDLGTGVNSSEELDVGEVDPEIGAQF